MRYLPRCQIRRIWLYPVILRCRMDALSAQSFPWLQEPIGSCEPHVPAISHYLIPMPHYPAIPNRLRESFPGVALTTSQASPSAFDKTWQTVANAQNLRRPRNPSEDHSGLTNTVWKQMTNHGIQQDYEVLATFSMKDSWFMRLFFNSRLY